MNGLLKGPNGHRPRGPTCPEPSLTECKELNTRERNKHKERLKDHKETKTSCEETQTNTNTHTHTQCCFSIGAALHYIAVVLSSMAGYPLPISYLRYYAGHQAKGLCHGGPELHHVKTLSDIWHGPEFNVGANEISTIIQKKKEKETLL